MIILNECVGRKNFLFVETCGGTTFFSYQRYAITIHAKFKTKLRQKYKGRQHIKLIKVKTDK